MKTLADIAYEKYVRERENRVRAYANYMQAKADYEAADRATVQAVREYAIAYADTRNDEGK